MAMNRQHEPCYASHPAQCLSWFCSLVLLTCPGSAHCSSMTRSHNLSTTTTTTSWLIHTNGPSEVKRYAFRRNATTRQKLAAEPRNFKSVALAIPRSASPGSALVLLILVLLIMNKGCRLSQGHSHLGESVQDEEHDERSFRDRPGIARC